MADNVTLNVGSGGSISRSANRSSTIQTQICGLDLGGASTNAEVLITAGQQLAALSVPVVLTAAQITTLTPPAAITGFALEAGHLATIASNIPALGQALAAASTPVVLTALQIAALTPSTNLALETGGNLAAAVTYLDDLATLDGTGADAAVAAGAGGTTSGKLRAISRDVGAILTSNIGMSLNQVNGSLFSSSNPLFAKVVQTNTTPVISDYDLGTGGSPLPAGSTAATLAKGATARYFFDTSPVSGSGGSTNPCTKWSLLVRIGRTGTTALTNGVVVRVRRMTWNGTLYVRHPVSVREVTGTVTAASSFTLATTDSTSGQNDVFLSSVTGANVGDCFCMAGNHLARLEFGIVSLLTNSGTGVTLDAPLEYSHTVAAADTVFNFSDTFLFEELDGGYPYEIVLDYGQSTTGNSVIFELITQLEVGTTTQ